jgi:hypothetical protein
MKFNFLLFCCVVTTVLACNNTNPAPVNKIDDSTISEANLPKGKYIMDDEENNENKVKIQDGTIKGLNSTDTSTTHNITKPDFDLKRRYKNLLVFHADDTMKIKKAYIATLILGKDQILADIKEEVLESSNAKNDNIKKDSTLDIGSRMKARLVDMSGDINKGFDIELLNEDGAEQNITDKRKKAMWQWKLVPLTPGQQELSLAITVIEKNGDKVTLPTRNIPVVIYAEEESFGSKTMGFLEKNIQWVLASLCIPIFTAWFTSRMRHRHDNKNNYNNSKNNPPNPPQNNA